MLSLVTFSYMIDKRYYKVNFPTVFVKTVTKNNTQSLMI